MKKRAIYQNDLHKCNIKWVRKNVFWEFQLYYNNTYDDDDFPR